MIESRASRIVAVATGSLFSTIGLAGVAFAQTATPPPPVTPPAQTAPPVTPPAQTAPPVAPPVQTPPPTTPVTPATPPTNTALPPINATTQTTPATSGLPGATSGDPAQIAKDTEVIQPSAKTPPTPLPTKAVDPAIKPGDVKKTTLFDGHTPGQPLPADPTSISTLDDAIAVAFQHNPSIIEAQETALQTVNQVDEIKAVQRPTIAASGTYSRLANPSSASFAGGGTSPASISNPFGIGLTTTPPGTTPIALSSTSSSSGSAVNTATGASTSSGSTSSPTTSTASGSGSSSSSGSTSTKSIATRQTTTTGTGTGGTTTTTGGATGTTTGTTTSDSSGVSGGTDLNQESARVSITQLIDITGIVKASLKFGDLQEALSRLEIARIRQQTAYNVKNSYYNLLRSIAFVSVDEAAVLDSREQLRVTKAQQQFGVASQYDVLTAQTTLDNNEQALISARNQVALSKNAFANTVGLDPSTAIDPQPQTIPPLPPLDEEALITQAFSQRPEYAEADINYLKSGLNIRLARRNLDPYISVGAQVAYNGSDTAFGQNKTTAAIGGTLSIPLYDGGATKSAVDLAKSEKRGAIVSKDQYVKGIKAEVQQSIIAINDANQRSAEIAGTVTEAQEALRLANVRFRAGVGTQLDVSNAQAQLVQAESNQVNAQYDYLGALARLQLAVGTPQ